MVECDLLKHKFNEKIKNDNLKNVHGVVCCKFVHWHVFLHGVVLDGNLCTGTRVCVNLMVRYVPSATSHPSRPFAASYEARLKFAGFSSEVSLDKVHAHLCHVLSFLEGKNETWLVDA